MALAVFFIAQIAGLGLVLGSSITSALLPGVESDSMFLNFAGWTSDGLVRQAAAQFEAWTGLEAPTEVMRRVVEGRLMEKERAGKDDR